ncbi:type 1 glutamine amidotransferase [Candidatus Saccharibacteria bacterium]|nr:type 1 glutamine amidotransferase [Candidatus Saccharibacteria bacterium]
MNILIIEHAPGRAKGIEKTLLSIDPNVTATVARIYLDPKIPDFVDFDGIIVGGGPMGVYEIDKPEYSYIKAEADYLKNAINSRQPILAICFGHQLIAQILGGEVIRDEAKKEIGWYTIQKTDDGKTAKSMMGLPDSFTMFEYHYDRISKLPPNAIVLATSDLCDIQALSYDGLPISSFQFHPELDAALGNEIFESSRDKLTNMGYDVDQILEQSQSVSEPYRLKVFENFLKSIK